MPRKATKRTVERIENIRSILSNGVYSLSKLARTLNLSISVVRYITSILAKRGEIYCATYGKSVRLCAPSKEALDSTLKSIVDLTISTVANSGAALCKSKCCSVPTTVIVSGIVGRDIRYVKLASALYRLGVPITSRARLAAFLIAVFKTYLGDSISAYKRSRRTRVKLCEASRRSA